MASKPTPTNTCKLTFIALPLEISISASAGKSRHRHSFGAPRVERKTRCSAHEAISSSRCDKSNRSVIDVPGSGLSVLASELGALPAHALADDLGQPQRSGARVVAVRED